VPYTAGKLSLSLLSSSSFSIHSQPNTMSGAIPSVPAQVEFLRSPEPFPWKSSSTSQGQSAAAIRAGGGAGGGGGNSGGGDGREGIECGGKGGGGGGVSPNISLVIGPAPHFPAWASMPSIQTMNPQLIQILITSTCPQLSTLNPSTLNPQPSTLNPQPSTLNPQPQTLSLEFATDPYLEIQDMSWPDLPGASTPSIVGSNSDASSARDELMTSRASTRNGSRRNASLHSHQSSLWTHRQSPVPQYSASKANWGCIAGADGEKDAVGWEVKTKPGRDVVETGEDEVIDDIDVDDLRQVMGQLIFRHMQGR